MPGSLFFMLCVCLCGSWTQFRCEVPNVSRQNDVVCAGYHLAYVPNAPPLGPLLPAWQANGAYRNPGLYPGPMLQSRDEMSSGPSPGPLSFEAYEDPFEEYQQSAYAY